MILVQANALFVRIPKCATIWCEGVLRQSGIACRSAERNARYDYGPASSEYARHVPPWAVAARYAASFALVRHPVSWYESWYRYQRGHWAPGLPGTSHPNTALLGLGDDDFNVYVRNVLEREPGYVTRLYEWFLGPENAKHVDYVGRVEESGAAMVGVLSALGYTSGGAAKKPMHVSPAAEIRWDPALRERVVAVEAPAIRRFYPDGWAGWRTDG